MLSAEDFEDRFGWQKPGLEKEVVFFCKAGVRSSAAAQLAKQAGYVLFPIFRFVWGGGEGWGNGLWRGEGMVPAGWDIANGYMQVRKRG